MVAKILALKTPSDTVRTVVGWRTILGIVMLAVLDGFREVGIELGAVAGVVRAVADVLLGGGLIFKAAKITDLLRNGKKPAHIESIRVQNT